MLSLNQAIDVFNTKRYNNSYDILAIMSIKEFEKFYIIKYLVRHKNEIPTKIITIFHRK